MSLRLVLRRVVQRAVLERLALRSLQLLRLEQLELRAAGPRASSYRAQWYVQVHLCINAVFDLSAHLYSYISKVYSLRPSTPFREFAVDVLFAHLPLSRFCLSQFTVLSQV